MSTANASVVEVRSPTDTDPAARGLKFQGAAPASASEDLELRVLSMVVPAYLDAQDGDVVTFVLGGAVATRRVQVVEDRYDSHFHRLYFFDYG